jgi:hypothetical protein
MTDPQYHLVLRPLPSAYPAITRLRRALKFLLRTFGLECVQVEEVPGALGSAQDGPRGDQEGPGAHELYRTRHGPSLPGKGVPQRI